MQQTRCVNCLKIITPEAKKCPYCGYDQNCVPMHNKTLRLNTILKGRYLVGREIGKGAFGITYVGKDLTIEKKVAVREFYPAYAWNSCDRNHGTNRVLWGDKFQSRNDSEKYADYIDRIFKRAQQAAGLPDSPSITKVYGAFRENGTVYIVEEFVEGKTLREYLMGHGSMTWNECRQMLFPVMEGIEKAHDLGLVHGAISPLKIIVQTDRTAKLTGLEIENRVVKSIKEDDPELGELPLLTRDFFMAREAAYGINGRPVGTGSWTDVYAFAAVILYCVTGEKLLSCFDRLLDLPWWHLLLAQPEDLTDVRELLKRAEKVPAGAKEILSKALRGHFNDMGMFKNMILQAEKNE